MLRTVPPVLLVSLFFGVPVYGQHREFAFGIGYTHLFWDGSNSDALEEQGGLLMEGRVSWPLAQPTTENQPELRIGLGLGLTFYVSEQGGDVVEVGNVIIIEPDDWTQLTTITPEVQFSVRQPVGDDYYLEPGVAGVFMLGNYVKGEEVFGFVDEEDDRWAAGGGGRVFLRGAYRRERWSVGLEGSYGYGWLHFGDDIGGDIQQGYFGIFYARRF